MPDDKHDEKDGQRKATGSRPPRPRPTLDETEQGRQSLALLDAIYDDAGDAAEEEDAPVDARGRRLAALAQRMVDDLPRHIAAAGRRRAGIAPDGTPSDGKPVAASELGAIDTGRIVAMSRLQLESLVNSLHDLRGDTPLITFDGLTDDELREMARRLRPARHL